ncbi:MAG: SurA N-terminal domain-containing protein [Robiginitomaculum sp.]
MSNSLFGIIKKILFTVLIGLLLASLAVWGVSDAFTPSSKNAAALVGKEQIKLQDFFTLFNKSLRDRNKENPSNRWTTKQAVTSGLDRQVINQMVTRTLIDLDSDSLGLEVNRRDARQFVEDIGSFNNEITGELDFQVLYQRLRQIDSNLSPKEFEQEIRYEIRRSQSLQSAIAGVITPRDFSNQLFHYASEQRKVKLLVLTKDAIETPADPGDEVLKLFITDNSAPYTAPEYRRFTLLRMEMSDVLPDMEITDEDIKEQYDYKVETKQLGTSETRSLVRLVAPTKNEADKITSALNDGQALNDVIKKMNLDTPTRYNNILKGATTDPVTSEIGFSTKGGEAKTVKSSFDTWYTVFVTAVTPAIVPSLISQRDSIIEELKNDDAQVFLGDALSAIQDNLDAGFTLEEAGKENGVSVASFDYVSRLGENEEGIKLAGNTDVGGISTDDKILQEIFTSDIDFDGDVFETSKKGIAAVRVDKIKDSVERPFETVREKVLAAWRLKQTNEALGELTSELGDKAIAGESLESIAASLGKGAEVKKTFMMRTFKNPELSGALAERLFGAPVDRIVRGIGANGLNRIVAQVTEIVPTEDKLMGEISDQLKKQAKQSLENDIYAAYQAALLQEHPAKILTQNIQKSLGIGN